MVAWYINSHIVCGLFCSWWGAPSQSFECSIWDCVGFYMIHTFLNPLVECQVKSFLSLIISFLVQQQHLLLLSLIVASSQVRVGTPLPFLSCCISGLGLEDLLHRGPYLPAATMVGYCCVGWCWQLEANIRSYYCKNSKNCLWKYFFIPT